MSPNKLKEWRVAVDKRLSALEGMFRPRSSTPLDIEHKSQPAVLEKQTESGLRQPKKRHLATLGKGIVLLLTWLGFSLGVVTGYLALVPKVTVVETDPLNPEDIFTSQFIISNDGPLGINSIDISCNIGNVAFERDIHIGQTRLSSTEAYKTKMFVGERGAMPCPLTSVINLDASVRSADIYMVLKFRPDYTWWHIVRIFRFITIMDSKGKLHWLPEPISK